MSTPLQATSSEALRIKKAIDKESVRVSIYIAIDLDTAVECPCVQQSMWHKYDPRWHQNNMSAVDCMGTGLLTADRTQAAQVEKLETDMIILPRWSFGGWEYMWQNMGETPKWTWCAIDYKNYSFNRMDFQDNNKRKYTFRVTADLPYYIKKEATPVAMVYLMEPLVKMVADY